jgi:Tol biopolymer transport system component
LTRRRADLTTERTIVAAWTSGMIPTSVSPDGKSLIVAAYPSGRSTVARLSLEKPQEPEPLLGMTYASGNGVLSPDGRWIAYDAREGERIEIYVRPFPNVNDARVQISQGGGMWPLWSRDGRELFYVAGVGGNADRPVTAVPVKAANGTTFDWGRGVRLFNAVPFVRSTIRGYDISPDGSKFILVADPTAPAAATRVVMHFVTNWQEELKARVK